MKRYYLLAQADNLYYGENETVKNRIEIANEFIGYVQSQIDKYVYLGHMTRHILGLFHAQPKGKLWRRYISENAYKKGAGVEVIQKALELFE